MITLKFSAEQNDPIPSRPDALVRTGRHMWLQIAFLGAVLLVLPSAEGGHYRIIAGRRASTTEFPYQAELERMERHWCGGSIIHRSFILTASHCVKEFEKKKPVPPSILRVRVGNDLMLTGGVVHEISEIIPHEEYNDYSTMDQYDIALLRLATPLELTDRVGIIAMAAEEPLPGEMGWVTGYGKQQIMRRDIGEKRYLMAVELPVVGLEECRRKLQGVADDMICAGYKRGHRDSCTGDSGGPYAVNEELVGIVAWGIGCGREGLPGVYTNVALYKNWVEKKIRIASYEDMIL